MKRFVALLRAVNVSGQNRIPMAELRRALCELGLTGVETYLQSGNVVFDADDDDAAKHAAAIHGLIERDFGHDVRVLVLTAAELAHIAAANPFVAGGADEKSLHVTFLFAPADADGFAGRESPGAGGRARGARRARDLPLPAARLRPHQAEQLLLRARAQDARHHQELAHGARARRDERAPAHDRLGRARLRRPFEPRSRSGRAS